MVKPTKRMTSEVLDVPAQKTVTVSQPVVGSVPPIIRIFI